MEAEDDWHRPTRDKRESIVKLKRWELGTKYLEPETKAVSIVM
jgi:hypothetical protein